MEKLLKAIFALREQRIPKLHYIDELAQMLDLPEEVINPILSLTSDYTLARYPDVSDDAPYEQYNEEISLEKVEAAKRVFASLINTYKNLIEDDHAR